MRVDVTIKNQGNGSARSSRVGYYIGSGFLDYDSVSSLSAGSSADEYHRIDTSDLSPGKHCVGLFADYTGRVDESNESNNDYYSAALCFTVTAVQSSDLVVESPRVSDSSPNAGESFTFYATVRNQGSGSSSRTTLRYYRSTNSTISSSDTEVDTDGVSSLSSSRTSNESERLTAPSSAGTYYYGACVDSVTNESNTDNNCSSGVRVTVQATQPTPQVSITDASATEGNALSFTVTLSPAPTQSVTYYYATYQYTARGGGQDYQGKYATALTFSSGQTSKTITVSTVDDTVDEPDEQFYVYITDAASKHPNSGTPSDYLASATATIRDNDDSSTTDDHGNTRSDATSLSVGGSQAGQIEVGNDIDYFRVQVSGSGELTVYTTGSLDTVGSLESSSGSSLESDDDGGTGSNFRIARTVAAGTYYVKVESYGSNTGSYTLYALFSGTSTTPQVSITDASATEGNTLTFTVTLSPAPTQSVTYYYATYQGSAWGGGQDYWDKLATALTFSSGQTSKTITVSTVDDTVDEPDEQFYVYITDAASKHPSSGSRPSDYLASATATIRDDDTEPTLGRYTYTFSLNNKTYTVTSDNCYSPARTPKSESALRAYIAGLTIYNSRNETVRPTHDILVQLAAAHASACVINGISLGEKLNEINNLISYAQVYNKALRRIAGLSHALSFLFDAYGFEKFRQTVSNLPTAGLIDLDAIRVIGLNMVQGVLSFLGQKSLSEKQQMAVEIVSENFFVWPETALEGASDIYTEAKTNIDLSETVDVATIRDHMKALDAAREAVENAKFYIPTGWDLAISMYPELEGSVADVAVNTAVNVLSLLDPTGLIGATTLIIDAGTLRINLNAIEKILVDRGSLHLDFSQSPFDAFSAVERNAAPILTTPRASYVVDKDSGWVRLSGLSVSDADNDSLSLVVAVDHGSLRATGTIVMNLDVSDTDFGDAIGFRRRSSSSINTALATLEYRPARNWEEGRDFILLWVTDNRVQKPVFGLVPIDSDTQDTPSVPDPDFCRDFGPCSAGQGDCDPGQCASGLVCVNDVGAQYGLPAHYDVCETPGGGPDPDFCRDFGPCSDGQGDCDPGQCGPGLECVDNVGAQYGLPAHYDVCETPGGGPDPDFCRDFGPCSAGQGDCDPGQMWGEWLGLRQ